MRILVVEDDTGIALGLQANLQQRGYAVDVCGTLGSAWSALCGEPFDLVLLELALRNLINNALQHSARGAAVCVRWGSHAGSTWLEVCDDGQGSSPGAAAPAPSAERLGLGHKIVSRVMDIHGGSFTQRTSAMPADLSFQPDRLDQLDQFKHFNACYRLCFPAVS